MLLVLLQLLFLASSTPIEQQVLEAGEFVESGILDIRDE